MNGNLAYALTIRSLGMYVQENCRQKQPLLRRKLVWKPRDHRGEQEKVTTEQHKGEQETYSLFCLCGLLLYHLVKCNYICSTHSVNPRVRIKGNQGVYMGKKSLQHYRHSFTCEQKVHLLVENTKFFTKI